MDKILYRCIVTLLAMVVMVGCSSDETINMSKGLSVGVSVEGWNEVGGTRATYSPIQESSGKKVFKASFNTGDKIGIFLCDKNGKVVIANMKFTYDGSKWNTDTPFEYFAGLGNHLFFAYYPYQESLQGAVAVGDTPDVSSADTFFSGSVGLWTPAGDQGSLEKFTSQDLMISKGNVSMPYFQEVNVSFSMSHKMGLLITKKSLDYYNVDDPSDTWSEVQNFSGNIPYELGGLCYFFAKPNVSTTLGSKTTKVGSGQVEQLYFSGGEPSNR